MDRVERNHSSTSLLLQLMRPLELIPSTSCGRCFMWAYCTEFIAWSLIPPLPRSTDIPISRPLHNDLFGNAVSKKPQQFLRCQQNGVLSSPSGSCGIILAMSGRRRLVLLQTPASNCSIPRSCDIRLAHETKTFSHYGSLISCPSQAGAGSVSVIGIEGGSVGCPFRVSRFHELDLS